MSKPQLQDCTHAYNAGDKVHFDTPGGANMRIDHREGLQRSSPQYLAVTVPDNRRLVVWEHELAAGWRQ
jgi:hypothetical protein